MLGVVGHGTTYSTSLSHLKPMDGEAAAKQFDDDPTKLWVTLGDIVSLFGMTIEELHQDLKDGKLIAHFLDEDGKRNHCGEHCRADALDGSHRAQTDRSVMTDKMKWTAEEWLARQGLEVEWLSAGYIRSKRTGRWHAVLKQGDDMVMSEQSFKTREEALVFLKRFAEERGALYRPPQ